MRPADAGASTIPHALTVDVEDWFHLLGAGAGLERSRWDHLESRVEASTDRLLGIFDRAGVRGTFFFLGWIAHRYPGLVQAVAEKGHEIGVHGYWHDVVYEQSRETFTADLDDAIDALAAAGARPVAYRAPSFSVTPAVPWVFEALAERRIFMDSSVFPATRDRGGYPGAPMDPFPIETSKGTVWEFPLTVLPVGPVRFPVSGGGYLRAMPRGAFFWAWRRVQAAGRTGILYIHPRDLDAHQPRPGMPLKRKVKSYIGLRGCQRKLEGLLRSFSFAPLSQVLSRVRDEQLSPAVLPRDPRRL